MSAHRWGESAAVDRVWAQVSGLPPSQARDRLLMIWQAYADESVDEDGTFVVAGYISTAERWASFASEWEPMVKRWGRLGPVNVRRFKMQEMPMDELAPFFRTIENHVLLSFALVMNENDLKAAHERVRIYTPSGRPMFYGAGIFSSPFTYALFGVFDGIHGYLAARQHPQLKKIDFIFDDRFEKRKIISAWDVYVETRPQAIRDILGATPRFENDEDFLPLQAADFWAYWVRRWSARGEEWDPSSPDFPGIMSKYIIPSIVIRLNQDSMFESICSNILARVPLGTYIRDKLGRFPDVSHFLPHPSYRFKEA